MKRLGPGKSASRMRSEKEIMGGHVYVYIHTPTPYSDIWGRTFDRGSTAYHPCTAIPLSLRGSRTGNWQGIREPHP